MQCRAVNRLPEGPDWEYELKFDGYRALAFKTNRRVWLMSRNGRDFAPLFPALVRALEKLPNDTVIDGEIVALNPAGQPSFNLLQNYQTAAQTIVFYAFDLLVMSGRNLTDTPLQERRELLQTRVMRRLREPIRFSETLNAPLERVLEAVRSLGLEGVIFRTGQCPCLSAEGYDYRPFCRCRRTADEANTNCARHMRHGLPNVSVTEGCNITNA